MPASDKTLLDWAEELDMLVRDGISAVQSDDSKAMVIVQKALRQFIDRSPDYADALDHEANIAVINIDLQNTSQAIAELKARRDELARIIKSMQGIVAELQKDSATLRLEAFQSAVQSVTQTIDAFKAVRSSLKSSGADKSLGDKIAAAIGAIQEIRNKMEQL